MSVVADTNLIAYFLLGTSGFYDEAENFWARAAAILAPQHWQAELANVIWLACRAGQLTAREAQIRLERAGRMPIRTSPVRPLWAGALQRSIATGVAVYDTLFVELAVQNGCRLATFDRQVARAFPKIACRPRELYPA